SAQRFHADGADGYGGGEDLVKIDIARRWRHRRAGRHRRLEIVRLEGVVPPVIDRGPFIRIFSENMVGHAVAVPVEETHVVDVPEEDVGGFLENDLVDLADDLVP